MDIDLISRFKKIKLLAMDFDGIMTDGHVYVGQDGGETVFCSRKDGMGINLLKKAGIDACVISSELNPVVSARCKKLGIPCWQNVESTNGKLGILQKIAGEKGLAVEEVAYMGDDVNDLAALEYAGLSLTVLDGHPDVKAIANYVTSAIGGKHAVREVCELILQSKGLKPRY